MGTLRHVALVEDDADIRAIARLALASVGGLEVSLYASGEEALRGLPRRVPDLVILDVMMPGLDGPATLAALRELEALVGVPVVFMTARVGEAEARRLLGLGAVGVLDKPFDPMTLASRVQEIWTAR